MTEPRDEAELEQLVAEVRADPARRDELVAVLREDAAVYRDRGASAAARIRGWVLAACADVGLPDGALPFVLEDLENDVHGAGVAAAARASRGLVEPSPLVAAALVDALERMRARDDAITFEALAPVWPAEQPTTVLVEIIAAIGHAGSAAGGEWARLVEIRAEHAPTWTPAARDALDRVIVGLPAPCCGGAAAVAAPPAGSVAVGSSDPATIATVVLEDHDGRRTTFGDWFGPDPVVVGFFYTRCPNPNKCSLTVTKLGELARRLAGTGVRVAGVTYDPGFDDPPRLRGYADARDVPLGDGVAMLRPVGGIEPLRRQFALRVGYVGSIVNRHAIELFLTAPGGAVERAWARAQWDVEEVAAGAASLTAATRR